MYNVRYHIASLVAVFLALALGLVLGGLVVRQGGFDQQQQALVAGLRKDFDKLKRDNTSLKASLATERAYSGQMTDAWAAGRLAGRAVIVITSGAKGEGAEYATAAIKSAGGTPVVVTVLKTNLGLGESSTASQAASIVGTATPVKSATIAALVGEWTQPLGERPVTDTLVKAGSITVSGLAASTAATEAVDIAAFDGKPDPSGLEIAQAYARAGLYAVGAQTPLNDSGVAAAAAARNLSAFDTLGTNPGRFTLIALLTGGQQGSYSNAQRATSAFPPVPRP